MLMFLNLLALFIYLIGESDFFAAADSFDFLRTLALSKSAANNLMASEFLFLASFSNDINGYSECAPD